MHQRHYDHTHIILFIAKPLHAMTLISHCKLLKMGGSKHKKKNKQKRQKVMEGEEMQQYSWRAAPNPPQNSHHLLRTLSLKKVRGTANSTPLAPEWSGHTSKSFLSPSDGSLFDSCKRESCYRGFYVKWGLFGGSDDS
jgi:hypothetical protein